MRLQNDKNKINVAIETTLKNLSGLVDVNTVIGKPLKTEDGELVVPISKVTIGVLSGGGEYGKINVFSKNESLPFSAGNGAIISMKPCGFLIKDEDKFKIISVSDTALDKLVEKATDFIAELNSGDSVQ